MSHQESLDQPGPIVIRIGVPAWGLPSWDIRSLQLLFLLHFNDVSHSVEYERYGYSSSTGDMPACEPGDGSIASAEITINKYSDQLDRANPSDNALAYRILCESRILPVCRYALFESDRNFNHLVYGLFSSIPFPFCAYLPRKLRRKALSYLAATTTLTESQRLVLCENALLVCEAKLETDGTPFLLGSKPTSGDAALCAFLMFARHCPVEVPDLKRLITPVLSDYIDQVLQLFPEVSKIFEVSRYPYQYRIADIDERIRAENDPTSSSPEEQLSSEELLRQRGNRIAIGMAAGAFVGFILLSSLNSGK